MSDFQTVDQLGQEQHAQSKPWFCMHTRFTPWTTIGFVTILNGMGGRTELVNHSRYCLNCHVNQTHWFDAAINPNEEGVVRG